MNQGTMRPNKAPSNVALVSSCWNEMSTFLRFDWQIQCQKKSRSPRLVWPQCLGFYPGFLPQSPGDAPGDGQTVSPSPTCTRPGPGVMESWTRPTPDISPETPRVSQAPLYYGATRGWNPETLKPREFWQHGKLAFWDTHEKKVHPKLKKQLLGEVQIGYDHTKTCWKYLYIKAARSKRFPHKPRKTDDALQPSYSHNKSQYQPEQEHIKNNCTRRC